jgi:hypothetical protein
MLFVLSGYVVGAVIAVICALDILFAVPFSRVNLVFDIGDFKDQLQDNRLASLSAGDR